MKRIGIDLRLWRSNTGGIGRYSRNLLVELLRLDKENHYTAIITPEDKPEFNLRAENLSQLVVDIPQYSASEQTKLVKILNEQDFDLVHFTHFNHPILYRRPFVITVHDLIMHLYPSGAQKRSLLRKLAYRWVMKDSMRASKIIVPSQSTKSDLISMLGFDGGKIVVTPEGSEGMFRTHSDQEKESIKKKLGLPERYLLFVSRWEEYKGLAALLEAYSQLHPSFPSLGLVICGKPAMQSPGVAKLVLEAQKKNPLIITPGFVSDEDLAPLYSAAAVYVHPSWYEGFGIMILEAFASGTPVVTSNISSLPEVVGEAGLLVDPRSPNEIANKIKTILDDPNLSAELAQKGLDRVKKYSWADMAKKTLDVYNEAIASK